MTKEKKFYNIKEIKEKEKERKVLRDLNSSMKKQYNITLSEYNRLFDHQLGKCYICGKEQEKKRLAIDHDHKTGKLRGLLCHKCNMGIGMFNEDVSLLINAINYINNTEWFYPDKFVYSDTKN